MSEHKYPVCASSRMARHTGKDPIFSCLDCRKTFRLSVYDNKFHETLASKRVATRKPAPMDTVTKNAEKRWEEKRST